MKGAIIATVLTFSSCINMQLEKHTMQLVTVCGSTIVMYDYTLEKDVRITYSYDLFKLGLGELNAMVIRESHPIFVFMCDVKNLIYYQL
jgi:hypothetical protein